MRPHHEFSPARRGGLESVPHPDEQPESYAKFRRRYHIPDAFFVRERDAFQDGEIDSMVVPADFTADILDILTLVPCEPDIAIQCLRLAKKESRERGTDVVVNFRNIMAELTGKE